MEKEIWKFGYVRDKDIIVFNRPIYHLRALEGHCLENVKLEVNNSGVVNRIEGTEITYKFYPKEVVEGDWDIDPDPSSIRVRETGFWDKRSLVRYLVGWVKLKNTSNFSMEIGSGWNLERRQ